MCICAMAAHWLDRMCISGAMHLQLAQDGYMLITADAELRPAVLHQQARVLAEPQAKVRCICLFCDHA